MRDLIEEGKAKINVICKKIVSKGMEVFYNPVMKHNRDISVLLLKCLGKKDMQIGLPLSGSGIRGIRFLLELNSGIIKNISFNDYSKDAFKSIKENIKLNKVKLSEKICVYNEDANIFLLDSCGFDYIDVDPFGTPNPFLDSSVKRIARGGILAVSATDTSALCGTYPKACKRKYWANPIRDEIMHETGIRILIRKVQLIGAQFDKALIPVFCYSKDHYFRIFFRCDKGKKTVDDMLEKHGMLSTCGPIFLGKLWDKNLAEKIYLEASDNIDFYGRELVSFLEIIKEEAKIEATGFYDIHSIIKKNKMGIKSPRKDFLIEKIIQKGFKASGTHFSGTGIRSEISSEDFKKLLR